MDRKSLRQEREIDELSSLVSQIRVSSDDSDDINRQAKLLTQAVISLAAATVGGILALGIAIVLGAGFKSIGWMCIASVFLAVVAWIIVGSAIQRHIESDKGADDDQPA